jgi:predicted SnoaL-like aldol condensation-catalyzing enzyme
MTRTAREVVELYNYVAWNERNFELAEELFGDVVIRHDVEEVTTLTHEQAIQRIKDTWAMFDKLHFDLPVVVAGDDGEHVAIVYQMTGTTSGGDEVPIASTEVFHVVDGKIVEVWNCGYKAGYWK